jgi:hypothetical protein
VDAGARAQLIRVSSRGEQSRLYAKCLAGLVSGLDLYTHVYACTHLHAREAASTQGLLEIRVAEEAHSLQLFGRSFTEQALGPRLHAREPALSESSGCKITAMR